MQHPRSTRPLLATLTFVSRLALSALLPMSIAGCEGIVPESVDGGPAGGANGHGTGGGQGIGGNGVGHAGASGAATGGAGGGVVGGGSGGSAGSGGKSGGSGGATGGPVSGGAGMTAAGTAGAKGSGGSTGAAGAKGATGGSSSSGGATGSGGSKGSGGATGAAGSSGAAGNHGASGSTGSSGGAHGSGGSATGGSSGGGSGGAGGSVVVPDGACSLPMPARAQPADTSNPTTVVGTGTADSCTFSALSAAVTKGGVITFDCGDAPKTILVTATMKVPTNKNTVIDGGNKITLDGGKAVQIMNFTSADFQANNNGLTLQHLSVVNGKATPTQMIPTADPPCSQGWNDGQGGAIFMRDGNLTVIDCVFSGNEAAPLGPDTGGGAIYVLGSKAGLTIVGSTFTNNSAANAGAVGGLFTELDIYNSVFMNNTATGHDANNDDASMCSVMNNGQNETGSGGNGGAIYSDGNSVNVLLCGDMIVDNAAGTKAFGGGLFFTSNDMGGTLTISDTTMTGNTGGHWTNVSTGTVKDAGTAVGTNTKSLTIKGCSLQGL